MEARLSVPVIDVFAPPMPIVVSTWWADGSLAKTVRVDGFAQHDRRLIRVGERCLVLSFGLR